MKIALAIIAVAAAIAAVVLIRSCGGDGAPETVATDSTATRLAAGARPETDAAGEPGAAGRLVDVGGHRLFVRTYGTGSPAVVIEPGLGDAGGVWDSVVTAVSDATCVVRYNRAGYDRSDPGPMPRGADRVVRELTSLLVATPIVPPYVVVGHSIGAVYALLYAAQHPNLVAGVVLLDPPPLPFIKGERFPELRAMADEVTASFRRDAGRARAGGDERRAAFLETVASEHETMFESGWSWMASVGSLGDTPMVVVGSGVPNPQFGASAEAFQQFWREESEALSRLSTRGRFVYVEDSTHNLPGEAPDVVVEAILYCLTEFQNAPEYDVWQGEK